MTLSYKGLLQGATIKGYYDGSYTGLLQGLL